VFETIPEKVRAVFEDEGLTVFSMQVYLSNLGPSIKMGAEYNWRRRRIDPLTPPASKLLGEQIKKKLREHGYKVKMGNISFLKDVFPNEFRIRILLKPHELSEETYDNLVRAVNSKPKIKTVREEFG